MEMANTCLIPLINFSFFPVSISLALGGWQLKEAIEIDCKYFQTINGELSRFHYDEVSEVLVSTNNSDGFGWIVIQLTNHRH